MNEDILQFNWKYGHLMLNGLKTVQGQRVEVIHPGELNSDSGPDFFNAKIKLDDTVWAGNVEIHVKTSDWEQHSHTKNAQYNSVVLHVVAINDAKIYNGLGQEIPTLIMPYPNELEWSLQQLVGSGFWIPCANLISSIPKVQLNFWIASLCIERMEEKTNAILQSVTNSNNLWEEAFYQSVARSLGLKINALPMELLAKATPLRMLSKYNNNPLQIEALLMGQAGFLEKTGSDHPHYNALRREYNFLKNKHQLSPIPLHLWKFLRLRPTAFPAIRLAQLAQLIHGSSVFFSKAIEAKNLKEFETLFKVGTSEFWDTHYTFDKESKKAKKTVGPDTISLIVINSVVPFLFAYGKARNNQALTDKALSILEELKSEKNAIVTNFNALGIKSENAYASQSLIQLKTKYCDRRKCLFCHVGCNILLKKSNIIE